MEFAIDGTVKIAETERYDVVIVGAGLAGLYTALNIDESLSCCILAKEGLDISNSWLAQGGIAAAISNDDTPVLHLEDTLIAGAGLCDEAAVRVLVDEGPGDIAALVSRGVPFDLDEFGDLEITREGGHRRNRILHAGGDATGRETVKALAPIVAGLPNVTISERTCFFDVICGADGSVAGLVARKNDEYFRLITTRKIVFATGGIGQVYGASTNPSVATGDGLAAAVRAGARLRNIEFIQFHPTGLWSPQPEDREFLISEAVRGEGGLLKNNAGVRFMEGAHELAELAPRDIVARAIIDELARSGQDHVFVDITSKSEEFLRHRFPTIYNECLRRGIDISREPIPVAPVQHYLMGGVETDLNARASIPGLYACGEVAYTGVHGANRLASNSMLECLVFGRRAAEDICASARAGERAPLAGARLPALPVRPRTGGDFRAMRKRVQKLMSEYGFVMRSRAGLEYALAEVRAVYVSLRGTYDESNEYLETLNISTVAKEILEAALARPESIGSHYIES
ncbi:MAG: L-aspartate oxidase [Oscillospiraceae bacterium]|jgi:L-aspartate oxidase|nr:L-aspartate oxidase [Oscillospiraceae bacterium]